MECMQLINKSQKVILSVFLFIIVSVFWSCSGLYDVLGYGENSGQVVIKTPEPDTDISAPSEITPKERLWTILVYMCADNDLEAAALEDLCEMEFSGLNTEAVTVLALVDRNPAYDTSYDNWYGSRLYRIQTGRAADAKSLISDVIECKDLGLSVGSEIELDMSSSYVLASSISYVKKRFPANNYGLIIWGHGTGWRGGLTESENMLADGQSDTKGFAFDSTSKTFMTLYQLGCGLKAGLDGIKFDFLGFDTCFGGEVEVLYELKDYAKYCVCSEGLISSSGWNYEALFSSFEKCAYKTSLDLCECAVSQFKKDYAYKTGASVVSVDMSFINQFFAVSDNLCKRAGNLINSSSIRDEVMNLIFSGRNCPVKRYTYGNAGSDIYLDVPSMMKALDSYFSDTEFSELYSDFCGIKQKCFLQSWASGDAEGGLGIYFSTLNDGLNLSVLHPAAYIKNKTSDQIAFVRDSAGYVPALDTGKSFLDSLFYRDFD